MAIKRTVAAGSTGIIPTHAMNRARSFYAQNTNSSSFSDPADLWALNFEFKGQPEKFEGLPVTPLGSWRIAQRTEGLPYSKDDFIYLKLLF